MYETLLGFKAFEWHHYLSVCPVSGSLNKVRRVSRKQYLANDDGLNYLRAPQTDQEVGNNTQWYSSEYVGVVENCIIRYGCILVRYPRSKFVINGGTGKVDYYFTKG